MKKTDTLILSVLQLCILLLVAHYQTIPGNIDADYYFMGGVRLAQGHGFTENYIWNYFNDPVSLPQPSHGYWLPLASIVTALGMWLTGTQSFAAGRIAFIILSVLIPPLTAISISHHLAPRPGYLLWLAFIILGILFTLSPRHRKLQHLHGPWRALFSEYGQPHAMSF